MLHNGHEIFFGLLMMVLEQTIIVIYDFFRRTNDEFVDFGQRIRFDSFVKPFD